MPLKTGIMAVFCILAVWPGKAEHRQQIPLQGGHRVHLQVLSPCHMEVVPVSGKNLESRLAGLLDTTHPLEEKTDPDNLTLQRIVLPAGLPKGITWQVGLPPATSLVIEHSRPGDVFVRGMESNLTVTATRGSIHLSGLNIEKGFTEAFTPRGDIRLEDSVTTSLLSTEEGRIRVTHVTGNPVIRSKKAQITFRDVDPRGEVVFIRNTGGFVDISTAPHGADIMTVGGNLQINSARKFVKARVIGGDITVHSLRGWIQAKTTGGNIHVTVKESLKWTRNDVRLTTLSGDITLCLPTLFPMKYRAEIRGLTDVHKSHRIINDFAVTGNTSPMAGPNISAGRTLNGKNQVELVTHLGDIFIRKE